MTITDVRFPIDLVLRRKRKELKGHIFYLDEDYEIKYWEKGKRWHTYHVPRGFGTDLASVPIGFRNLASKVDAIEGSVVHDHAYRFRTLPRRGADELMRAIMKASNKSWFKRNLMWLGVRIGGRFTY